MKSLKEKILKTDKDVLAVGIVLLVFLSAVIYGDCVIPVRQGITFWTALFDGNVLDYYR